MTAYMDPDFGDFTDLPMGEPLSAPTLNGGARVRRPVHPPDPAIAGRNRRSRNRGNRTSRDLAHYLGGRNIEGLLLPWDVEAAGCRIQSKRLARPPSRAEQVRLLRYIDASDALRGLYLVAPRQRLQSGTVTCLLEDWVADHGWSLPPAASLANAGGTGLVELPLPDFRDIHCGGEG